MLPDLVRHLVPFEYVLQRPDFEPELVGDVEQHRDLVGAIAVRVNQYLPGEHIREYIQCKVAVGFGQLLASGGARPIVVPSLGVLACSEKTFANHVLDAHPRGREARRASRLSWRVAALRVLAERHLDAARSAGDEHLLDRTSEFHLYDGVLSANRVPLP